LKVSIPCLAILPLCSLKSSPPSPYSTGRVPPVSRFHCPPPALAIPEIFRGFFFPGTLKKTVPNKLAFFLCMRLPSCAAKELFVSAGLAKHFFSLSLSGNLALGQQHCLLSLFSQYPRLLQFVFGCRYFHPLLEPVKQCTVFFFFFFFLFFLFFFFFSLPPSWSVVTLFGRPTPPLLKQSMLVEGCIPILE